MYNFVKQCKENNITLFQSSDTKTKGIFMKPFLIMSCNFDLSRDGSEISASISNANMALEIRPNSIEMSPSAKAVALALAKCCLDSKMEGFEIKSNYQEPNKSYAINIGKGPTRLSAVIATNEDYTSLYLGRLTFQMRGKEVGLKWRGSAPANFFKLKSEFNRIMKLKVFW